MTRFVGTPLRGIEFSSVSDEAISARVNGDGHPRIRIDAGGRITWSAGTSAGDTTLYRDGENTLTTDDVFKATSGLITLTSDGAPTSALANGALAIDTTNHAFYFRSDNTWNQVTGGGGGASIEIADSPPSSPEAGDLWFESDTGSIFVYYDSAWIEMGGASAGGSTNLDGLDDVVLSTPTNGQVLKYNGTNWVNGTDDAGTTINSLDDIGDVTIGSTIESGQFLRWNGTVWVNEAIDLGTDTAGNYVADVTAGTGVTVTHTPGEGSSASIAIGQAVASSDSPTFAGLTTTGPATIAGSSSTSIPLTVHGVSSQMTNLQEWRSTSASSAVVANVSSNGLVSGSAFFGNGIRIGIAAFGEIDTNSGGLTLDSNSGTTTIDDNLIVTGDLTVNGTTTTLNTQTLLVEDNIVTLNSNAIAPTVVSAGIEVYRGSGEFVPAVRWNEINAKWEISTDGTNYDAIQTETAVNVLQQKVQNQMTYLMCEVNP